MKLLWTDEAVKALKDIHDYIGRDSQSFASAWVEKILSRIAEVSGSGAPQRSFRV